MEAKCKMYRIFVFIIKDKYLKIFIYGKYRYLTFDSVISGGARAFLCTQRVYRFVLCIQYLPFWYIEQI